MSEILPILSRLRNILSSTTLRRLRRIVEGMLCISGRITQLGLSRWSGKGGSYRSIQRFFQSEIDWSAVSCELFRSSLYDPRATYILAGDVTVVGKSGQKTHGVDRFFSSTVGKPVPGLGFFEFALINTETGQACSLCTHQVVRTEAEKAQARMNTQRRHAQRKAPKKGSPLGSKQGSCQKKASGKKRGRPLGSKNKNKADIVLSPEMAHTFSWGQQLLARLGETVPLVYLALDGHYGNNGACQMVRRLNLHIISKLQYNSELYLQLTDEEKKEHPHRKYGARLDYAHLPEERRISSLEADGVRTEVYWMRCRHKEFADVLNVVVIVKTKLDTKQRAHVVLFSTDLNLDAQTLIKYYSLRFQIEFIFRDAKQYWGLEDFMGVTQRSVENAVGLSFFMVNLSTYLLDGLRQSVEQAGVNDLKTYCRGRRYVQEAMKYAQESPEGIDWERVIQRVCMLGLIHAVSSTRPLRC